MTPCLEPQCNTTTNWKSLLKGMVYKENLIRGKDIERKEIINISIFALDCWLWEGKGILIERNNLHFHFSLFSFLTVECRKFDDICLGNMEG